MMLHHALILYPFVENIINHITSLECLDLVINRIELVDKTDVISFKLIRVIEELSDFRNKNTVLIAAEKIWNTSLTDFSLVSQRGRIFTYV